LIKVFLSGEGTSVLRKRINSETALASLDGWSSGKKKLTLGPSNPTRVLFRRWAVIQKERPGGNLWKVRKRDGEVG